MLWTVLLTGLAWLVVPKLLKKLYDLAFAPPVWNGQGKRIVITGASSGIGEELAKRYAGMGARLVLAARREEELQRVSEECSKLGAAQVDCIVSDISKQEECRHLIETAAKKLDGVFDCIILNAGISMGECFEDVKDLSIFRRLMDVNYYGCIDCTKFALPYLKRSKHAKIVVMSSIAGKGGVPTRSGYCASKFALHGFYDSLRCELKSRYNNIDVCIICPGFVKTNINNTRLGDAPQAFDEKKAMSVETAGEIMVSAIEKGKREEVMTSYGKAGVYVRFFLPELYDWISLRAMQHVTGHNKAA
ncbi:11-beta-hydroxysteroid dehydrogenase-like 6 [Balamuthia mandrillaris]